MPLALRCVTDFNFAYPQLLCGTEAESGFSCCLRKSLPKQQYAVRDSGGSLNFVLAVAQRKHNFILPQSLASLANENYDGSCAPRRGLNVVLAPARETDCRITPHC